MEEKLILEEINDSLDKFDYDVINEEVSGKKKYYIRGAFSKADVVNKNKRVYPLKTLKESVDSCQPIIKEKKMIGELEHPSCLVGRQYSVLTKGGWKDFDDIKVGEEALSLNDDGVFEYKKILEIIDQPYTGKVYHVKGRNIDSTFTPNHRFYLKGRYGKNKVATIEEIYNNRTAFGHDSIIKTGEWVGNGLSTVIIENSFGKEEFEADKFFAFMGFYLAEGCISQSKRPVNNSSIFLSQNYGETSNKVKELLVSMNFNFKEYKAFRRNEYITFEIKNKVLREYLRPLGKCYDKYIPEELKQYDAPYLETLVDWFIMGDGRGKGMKKPSYEASNLFSVSKKLVEDLHECLVKAGGSGNWRDIPVAEKEYTFAEHIIKPENKKHLYQLNIASTKGIYLDERFLSITEEDYSGQITCLSVEDNHNFYMKQNGKAFLTGNSVKINLDRIAVKINQLSVANDGTMIGEMEILDTPCGKTLQTLVDSGIGLGVSTRGIGTVKKVRRQVQEGVFEEIAEVQPDYRLRAIDIVFDPSAGEYGNPNFVTEGLAFDNGVEKETKKLSEVWTFLFS
jgi:hypothetical protein